MIYPLRFGICFAWVLIDVQVLFCVLLSCDGINFGEQFLHKVWVGFKRADVYADASYTLPPAVENNGEDVAL